MTNAIEEMRAINRSVGEIGSFVKERTDELGGDVSLLKEENERLRLDVAKLQERMRERRRTEVARVEGMERGIRVREGRFAGYSPLDVGIMRVVAQNHRDDPDAPYARVWTEQLREATRSLRSGLGADDVDRHFQSMERRMRKAYVRESLPGTLARDPELQYRQAVQPMLTHLRDMAMRAALDSTTAGSGDELVPTLERAELWMDVNLQTLVGGLIPVFPMPSQPFDIPTQLGDVNFFPGAENASVASSAPATGKVTLTAHELVAQVPFSFSLEEDNVLPSLLGEIRTSLVRNTAEALDDIILNADTTQTNSINADGASIRRDTAGKAHWLVGYNGLIHLPLMENAAMANNHNAQVSADMFNKLRGKTGRYGVRPSELMWVMDVNTFIRAQSVEEFRTMDKLGPNATLLSGMLGAVEGIPVIVSEHMRLADADGKVTDAGNRADTGRLLLVNRTQWAQGFRRNLRVDVDRDTQKRQTVVTVSFRHALTERSGNRSKATHTALQYNIKGVV